MSSIVQDIEIAITALSLGNLVAIPTETVYGLAGNAENDEAVKKIFQLKNRPMNHPLIMHVAKEWDLSRWVDFIPDYAKKLMDRFWPGPLTLVFNARTSGISPYLNGGQSTLAIRCPSHPIAQQLLQRLDFPLAAPSANPFGKVSPTTSAHVQQSFAQEPLLILEGGRCALGIESTIVAATLEEGYSILRHGSIDTVELQSTAPNLLLQHSSTLRSPGKLDQHYQPEKSVYCFDNIDNMRAFCQQQGNCYALSFSEPIQVEESLSFLLPNNPAGLAFELYYQLRQADESSASKIVVELPPNTEKWQAIRERLLKASVKSL